MNELIKRCLNLSREERSRLIVALKDSLSEDGLMGAKNRFSVLHKIATEICGHGILSAKRDFNLVIGRRMIAYQMRVEGYSLQSIGIQMVKHHASIMHMVKMMEDVFEHPDILKLEMSYWTEFQKRLKEYETNR